MLLITLGLLAGSGLEWEVLKPGSGSARPGPHDLVVVHYSARTAAGEEITPSLDGSPFRMNAQLPGWKGLNAVIPFWAEALPLLVVGERRRFRVPEALGYPGEGALVYEVELVAIYPWLPNPIAAWDPVGWTYLGEIRAETGSERSGVRIYRQPGRFDQIAIACESGEIELTGITVDVLEPGPQHTVGPMQLRAGAAVTVDLPGQRYFVDAIDLRHRAVPRRANVRLTLWARDTGGRPGSLRLLPTDSTATRSLPFDVTGWEPIGQDFPNLREERGSILGLSPPVGPFRELLLIANGGVSLSEVEILLADGTRIAVVGVERGSSALVVLPRTAKVARVSYVHRIFGNASTKVELFAR